MKQREIIVEHKYIDNKYLHCFDDENYNLLELERKVYLNENKELLEIKDQLMLEIERLNNIINELEKWLKYEINKSGFEQDYERKSCYEDILDGLEELKGSDKE